MSLPFAGILVASWGKIGRTEMVMGLGGLLMVFALLGFPTLRLWQIAMGWGQRRREQVWPMRQRSKGSQRLRMLRRLAGC
jgi:hypothetical protein